MPPKSQQHFQALISLIVLLCSREISSLPFNSWHKQGVHKFRLCLHHRHSSARAQPQGFGHAASRARRLSLGSTRQHHAWDDASPGAGTTGVWGAAKQPTFLWLLLGCSPQNLPNKPNTPQWIRAALLAALLSPTCADHRWPQLQGDEVSG